MANLTKAELAEILAKRREFAITSPAEAELVADARMNAKAAAAAKGARGEGVVLKTPEDRLNKTEKAYLQHCLLRCRTSPPQIERVYIQAITLRLADDTRYTPDFNLQKPGSDRITMVEVKGFLEEDALVKFKTAAAQFPMFDWVMIAKAEGCRSGWRVMYQTKGAVH